MNDTATVKPPVVNAGVVVYRVGICFASICCPAELPVEEVLAATTRLHPTGLDHGWQLSEAATFSSGQPNPCPCETEPGRVHRLLYC